MKGNAAVEYMLVVSILVLALIVIIYRPASSGRNLPKSFVEGYHRLAREVAKP